MNTILWIMQALLCAMFAMAGRGKISNTREQHIADGHIKPEQSLTFIRILGALELLGCVGIIVPRLINVLPILTPITAICFALIMIAGIFVHTQKKEYKMLPLLIVIFIFSITVAYFRFKNN